MTSESGKKPVKLAPKEMKAWRSYIEASRHLIDVLEGDLTIHNLSLTDYEILTVIGEAKGGRIRMSDLALSSLVSKSRLSHRIKAMEKLGWVRKESCPEDKRGSFASLTSKGQKVLTGATMDHLQSVKNRFTQNLTSKDHEEVTRIFSKLTDALRAVYMEDNCDSENNKK